MEENGLVPALHNRGGQAKLRQLQLRTRRVVDRPLRRRFKSPSYKLLEIVDRSGPVHSSPDEVGQLLRHYEGLYFVAPDDVASRRRYRRVR